MVVGAEFELLDVCREVVLANLLGVEVEEGDLRLGLCGLAEEVVHFGLLSLLESDDPVEGVELNEVEVLGVDDLSLLDFLLLLLGEGRPLEDVLLDFALCVLVEDEQNTAVVAHN